MGRNTDRTNETQPTGEWWTFRHPMEGSGSGGTTTAGVLPHHAYTDFDCMEVGPFLPGGCWKQAGIEMCVEAVGTTLEVAQEAEDRWDKVLGGVPVCISDEPSIMVLRFDRAVESVSAYYGTSNAEDPLRTVCCYGGYSDSVMPPWQELWEESWGFCAASGERGPGYFGLGLGMRCGDDCGIRVCIAHGAEAIDYLIVTNLQN